MIRIEVPQTLFQGNIGGFQFVDSVCEREGPFTEGELICLDRMKHIYPGTRIEEKACTEPEKACTEPEKACTEPEKEPQPEKPERQSGESRKTALPLG